MKGKNDPTTYLPWKSKIGQMIRYVKDGVNICFTVDQAKYIYKKLEQEGTFNVETTKQETEVDRLYNDNINEEKVKPYKNVIVNDFDRENIITSQMEQWLILSNLVYYVQYDRNPRDFYNLDIKAIDQRYHRKIYDRLKEEDKTA